MEVLLLVVFSWHSTHWMLLLETCFAWLLEVAEPGAPAFV